MNKIFVCFTCERDLALLEAQYAAIMRAEPNADVYYVFESGEHAQGPVGSKVVSCEFSHNGNLIGLEAHYGMLQVMRQLSEANGKCDVIKIDSDCYFIGDYPKGFDLIGTAPGHGYYCKGCCYKISYSCICKAIEYLRKDYVDVTGRIEDGTISMISAIVSKPNKVRILNAYNVDDEGKPTTIHSCAFQSGYYNQPEGLDNVKHFIDCGDSIYINSYKEANLPIPLAKARALNFLLNYFQKKSENSQNSCDSEINKCNGYYDLQPLQSHPSR